MMAPSHLGRDEMTTPEHIAMLNGRTAAVQAATADLLERGALRSDGHTVSAGATVPGMTDLQRAIHRAVHNGAPRVEQDRDVVAQLDLLQRDCVRRGLLHPPKRAKNGRSVGGLLLGGVILLVVLAVLKAPIPLVVVTMVAIVVALFFVIRRQPAKRERRTKQGIAALQQARAETSETAPLGSRVAAFGTRPLLLAFPQRPSSAGRSSTSTTR